MQKGTAQKGIAREIIYGLGIGILVAFFLSNFLASYTTIVLPISLLFGIFASLISALTIFLMISSNKERRKIYMAKRTSHPELKLPRQYRQPGEHKTIASEIAHGLIIGFTIAIFISFYVTNFLNIQIPISLLYGIVACLISAFVIFIMISSKKEKRPRNNLESESHKKKKERLTPTYVVR